MLRTPLVLLFGSLIVGCTVGDPGSEGDDQSTGGPNCGNGQVDPGEECDGGAGCSAACTLLPVPKLDLRVDKPTLQTELRTANMFTATLIGSNGFGGAVPLTAKVYDASNNELTAWTVTLNSPNANVPVDGSADVVVSVAIPSENKGLSGTLKITATPSGGPAVQVASAAITVLNQVTIPMTLAADQCVYPAADTVKMSIGSKIRWLNKATKNVTIHVSSNGNGIQHQPDPGTAPNGVYEQTFTGAAGNAFTWYCHAPGPTVNNLLLQAVAAP